VEAPLGAAGGMSGEIRDFADAVVRAETLRFLSPLRGCEVLFSYSVSGTDVPGYNMPPLRGFDVRFRLPFPFPGTGVSGYILSPLRGFWGGRNFCDGASSAL